jgi:hypothetical protein
MVLAHMRYFILAAALMGVALVGCEEPDPSAFDSDLSADEEELSTAKSALTAWPDTCEITITSSEGWQAELDAFLARPVLAPRTVCFAAGTYSGQIRISGKSNIRLRARTGDKVIIGFNQSVTDDDATAMIKDSTSVVLENIDLWFEKAVGGVEQRNATLRILGSTGVDLKNVSIANKSLYPQGFEHKVDRALFVSLSDDVNLLDSMVEGKGKQVLVADSANVTIERSRVLCYYFCLEADNQSNISSIDSEFVVNHEQDAGDSHSAMWVTNSDLSFTRSTFTFVTGNGLVAGVNDTSNNRIDVDLGTVVYPEKMNAWLTTHANYRNIRLFVTGTFSPAIRPFTCNPWRDPDIVQNLDCVMSWQRGNADPGTELHLRPDASTPFRSVPLPPAKPDAMLFMNTDSAWGGGAFRSQVLEWHADLSASFVNTQWQDWSTITPGSYGGWLDSNDLILTGDFLGDGKPQILLFNTDPNHVGGAIRIQELDAASGSFVNKYWQDWSTIAPSAHGGWLDPNDRILAGDFLGDGKTQILFFNTDPNHVGGAIRIQELDAASSSFVNKYWQDWSSIAPNAHGGWLDPNDRILAGDFLGDGKTQILFFNTDPNHVGGAIRIQEFDAASSSFVNKYWQDWSSIAPSAHDGWLDPNDRILAGDFLGDGKTQILFFNTDPNHVGGAIRIQEFDAASSSFVNKYLQDWSTIAPNAHGGWLDLNDRIMSIRPY